MRLLGSHVISFRYDDTTTFPILLAMACRHLPVLLLLLIILAPPSSTALSPDGLLLLALKRSIAADPLGVLSSWSPGDDTPCSWSGVFCSSGSGGSSVTSLLLPASGLVGLLPPELGLLPALARLDLSGNSLRGPLPPTLYNLTSLLRLRLSGNALSGPLPAGFRRARLLDLSLNLFNGSLPPAGVGGRRTAYLNLSGNAFSGRIPPGFAASLPAAAAVDLSSNQLSGEIPNSTVLLLQPPAAFAGNVRLCGRPLRVLCTLPSLPESPPALAVLPKTQPAEAARGLPPAAVAGAIVGDLVGVAVVSFLLLCLYNQWRAKTKKKKQKNAELASSSSEEEDEASPPSQIETAAERRGELVMVDGERELEAEALLKATAYILGATEATIVYKAVLADGSALAVRRLSDGGGGTRRELEAHVRGLAKLRHPNLVRVLGFYWGPEERLLLTEYVAGGSLVHLGRRRGGSSPRLLPWDARLAVARGVARALAYLHEKKVVHGHVKPSNVLLDDGFHPKLSDLGLDGLCPGVWRQRSSSSRRSQDSGSQREPSLRLSPYQAPESFGSLRPSWRWDVYAFGVMLLEMATGRAVGEAEVEEWGGAEAAATAAADAGAWREMEGREDVVGEWLRLGLSCASAQSVRRPPAREVLRVLDRMTGTQLAT